MDWIEAKPSDNFNNKFLLLIIINLLKIKLPKCYLELIINVVKNNKIYIFEKDIISIKHYLFWSCESLTNITIPNSVINIKSFSFYSCKGLTSITVPDSVTNTGEYAFVNCDNLITAIIPASITGISSLSFPQHTKIIRSNTTRNYLT